MDERSEYDASLGLEPQIPVMQVTKQMLVHEETGIGRKLAFLQRLPRLCETARDGFAYWGTG